MKRLARIPGLKIWTLLFLMGATLASCDSVLEEEAEDCATYVRFKYDMNMKFADAFPNAVKSVTLYVFDQDGKLFLQRTEEGEALAQPGYRMRLDEISRRNKDQYEYITWAGLADNDAFTVPLMTVGTSTKEDLFCLLERKHESRAEGDAYVDYDLEALFHGRVEKGEASRATGTLSDEVLVPLTKNTNNVRIVLQHMSGEPVQAENFRFTITDENGLMNYDNLLLDDEVITYKAWRTDNGYAGLGEEEAVTVEGVSEINVALAELTVARLMADERPILTISNVATGETVLSIPLIDYALMVKGYYNREMDDQEYLDRQDEYNMTFFLDEGNKWMNAYIYINSWRIVLQDTEL